MDDKKKLELNDEELAKVAGGACNSGTCRKCGKLLYTQNELLFGVCFDCKNPDAGIIVSRP